MKTLMQLVETEEQLETLLATPSVRDQELIRRLTGDVMILGAGYPHLNDDEFAKQNLERWLN